MENTATTEFYAHGKLLITGEYFVLDGAEALAIPTRFGQRMQIRPLSGNDNLLFWVALNNQGQPWLNLTFDLTNFECLNSDGKEAMMLSKILREAMKQCAQNPFAGKANYAIQTRLEFPNAWGLGSSSTLMYLIQQLTGADGISLLRNTMGGSGYDVAAAGASQPIVYKIENGKPAWEEVRFAPEFAAALFFVYTGKKQLSSSGISHYRENVRQKSEVIAELNTITRQMLFATSLQEFEAGMVRHEQLVGDALQMQPVKSLLFSDFWGEVKSLGAWGGDFVMMTHRGSEKELTDYLLTKNLQTAFSFNDMIFQPNT
ncbi:MAG: GYDIA family GHMP kinase [Chitinophagales bacterium]